MRYCDCVFLLCLRSMLEEYITNTGLERMISLSEVSVINCVVEDNCVVDLSNNIITVVE
jgi:hypothetical protein